MVPRETPSRTATAACVPRWRRSVWYSAGVNRVAFGYTLPARVNGLGLGEAKALVNPSGVECEQLMRLCERELFDVLAAPKVRGRLHDVAAPGNLGEDELGVVAVALEGEAVFSGEQLPNVPKPAVRPPEEIAAEDFQGWGVNCPPPISKASCARLSRLKPSVVR